MANTKSWVGTSVTGDANTAANYLASGVPATGDDLFVINTSQGITASLSALSGVTLANLFINAGFTGAIGDASSDLQISATNIRIGEPSQSSSVGTGSSRLRLNLGSNQFTATIVSSATGSTDTGLEPIRIKGSHASNKLYVIGKARVGFATSSPSDTGTLSEFSVTDSSAVLNLGAGTTWTTGYQTAGTVLLNSGGTTFTQEGGTATFQGAGVVRTITCGGTLYINQRPSAQTASSVTRSSTTATATVTSHGYVAGDTVYVSGANEANYNGFAVITNTGTNTFDWTISSVAPTPATGTVTVLKAISSLTVIDGGAADFSADIRDVAVATLVQNPGSIVRVNRAKPSHLIIGTRTFSNAAEIAAT